MTQDNREDAGRGTARNGAPVIEVEDLNLRRNGRTVLRQVGFRIEEKELVGIIGPNGGGKTTMLQVILGVIRPYQGRVRVLGREPSRLEHARGEIGYVPQSKRFDRDFPARARDVVVMGTYTQVGLLRWPGSRERNRALEALDQMGMAALANRPIGRLSGGEQQRVFIAQALVSRPKLLILDEPTVGVDREGEESLIDLLLRLRAESDLTVLMVSHNVTLIRAHTDRILGLNRELIFNGPASRLSNEKIAEMYHAHPSEMHGV
jgi:zinc transport system ATP-binding protein